MVVVAGAEKVTVPVAPLNDVTPILVRVIPLVEVVTEIPEPVREIVEVETPANEAMYAVDDERKSDGFFPWNAPSQFPVVVATYAVEDTRKSLGFLVCQVPSQFPVVVARGATPLLIPVILPYASTVVEAYVYVPAATVVVARAKVDVFVEVVIVICPAVP